MRFQCKHSASGRSNIMIVSPLFRSRGLTYLEGVPMRLKLWTSLSVLLLTVGIVFAQDAAPPTRPTGEARVVRVRIVHTGGMCGGFGYCTTLTTVEPSFIVLELKDSGDKKKLPDRKTRRAITKQDWENLQRVIDAKSLIALPQMVCRAAIDLPCSWVEVEFSDRTKVGVSYDDMKPPAPVAALLGKIPTVLVKLNP